MGLGRLNFSADMAIHGGAERFTEYMELNQDGVATTWGIGIGPSIGLRYKYLY